MMCLWCLTWRPLDLVQSQDKIIEIGAVKVQNGKITEKFSTFVNPKIPIPFRDHDS